MVLLPKWDLECQTNSHAKVQVLTHKKPRAILPLNCAFLLKILLLQFRFLRCNRCRGRRAHLKSDKSIQSQKKWTEETAAAVSVIVVGTKLMSRFFPMHLSTSNWKRFQFRYRFSLLLVHAKMRRWSTRDLLGSSKNWAHSLSRSLAPDRQLGGNLPTCAMKVFFIHQIAWGREIFRIWAKRQEK